MAKPHEDRGVTPGRGAPTRTQKIRTSSQHAIGLCVGLSLTVLAGQVLSQPAPQTTAEQEQRRADERERTQRGVANGILKGDNPGGGGVQFYISMDKSKLPSNNESLKKTTHQRKK